MYIEYKFDTCSHSETGAQRTKKTSGKEINPSKTLTDDFNIFVFFLIIASLVVCVPPPHLHPRSDLLRLAGNDDTPPPLALLKTEIVIWALVFIIIQQVPYDVSVSLTHAHSRLLPSSLPGPRCAT